jgi:hypothetical protein
MTKGFLIALAISAVSIGTPLLIAVIGQGPNRRLMVSVGFIGTAVALVTLLGFGPSGAGVVAGITLLLLVLLAYKAYDQRRYPELAREELPPASFS